MPLVQFEFGISEDLGSFSFQLFRLFDCRPSGEQVVHVQALKDLFHSVRICGQQIL